MWPANKHFNMTASTTAIQKFYNLRYIIVSLLYNKVSLYRVLRTYQQLLLIWYHECRDLPKTTHSRNSGRHPGENIGPLALDANVIPPELSGRLQVWMGLAMMVGMWLREAVWIFLLLYSSPISFYTLECGLDCVIFSFFFFFFARPCGRPDNWIFVSIIQSC